jgi:hypothetical protein
MKKNEKYLKIYEEKLTVLIFAIFIMLFLVSMPIHAQMIVNGNFETGDFTGWTVTGPHYADVTQHEGSWSGHIDILTGNGSNSNTPNEFWQMVGQTIFIPEAIDSLNFYMGVVAQTTWGNWHRGGYVWIMDSDSVGIYTRLFHTGGGGGNATNYPWEFHRVSIEAWAGNEVTIYFAGHNGNGYADHQCDIYFDNVTFHDIIPPTVTVDVPNGGETWMVGEIYQIEWTAQDDIGIFSGEIFYSTYNGTNWTLIDSFIGNPQTYDWLIPNTTSTNCLIKVVVYDAVENSGEDVSDAVFTITSDTSPPTVEIVSPNGGENWEVFEWHQVTWVADDDVGVVGDSVFYSANNGVDWNLLVSHTGNPQNYYWSIPNAPSNECLIKVVAYDLSGNSTEDISDGTFIISYDEPPLPDYAVVIKQSTYDDPDWQTVADALIARYQGELFIWNNSPDEVLADVAEYEPTHIGFVCDIQTASPNFIQNNIWPFTRNIDDDVYSDAVWGIITGYNAADALNLIIGPTGFNVRTVLGGTDACDLEYYPQGIRTYEEIHNRYDVKYSDSNEIEEFTDGPTDRTEWLVTMLNEGIEIFDYNPVDIFYTNGSGFHNFWQLHYPSPGQEGFFRSFDGQVYGEPHSGTAININSDNSKIYFGLGNSDIGQIYSNGSMPPSWIHTGGAAQYTGYLIDEEADSYQHGATKAYFYKVARSNTWSEAFLLGNIALQYDLMNGTPGTNPPDLDGSVLYGDPGMQIKMSQQGEFKTPLFTSELIINAGTNVDTVTFKITMNREGNPGFTGKWGERHPAIILPFRAKNIDIIYTNAIDAVVEDNFALMYIWYQGQPSLAEGEIREVTFTYNLLTGVEEQILTETSKVILYQNYPNPFNTETTITFSLAENTGNTELSIYNIVGQKVITLINKELSAGKHSFIWKGNDKNNKQVPTGIYYCKIKSGKITSTKKMIILR